MLLITGSNGQLGSELSKCLPEAVLADIDTLDITNARAVVSFVEQNKIDTIINCAAYTNVDQAEDNLSLATKINVDGPRNLAVTGAKIIHISTDYVFDGMTSQPYKTNDAPTPISVYGQTKLAGEKAVLGCARSAFVIRTAWLYSTYGSNFVKTMQKLGAEKEHLNVVFDQIGSPTYAKDLAGVITALLPRLQTGQKAIYHYTNEGVCSWYDFACEIMELSHLNCHVNPILSSEYPTRAIRPFYSVLDKSKIKTDFGIEIPHWKESLKRYFKDI